MLLDASSQRAKSWSCENCKNLNEIKDIKICEGCFWAWPENYSHVAMTEERRLTMSWQGEETKQFDVLSEEANKDNISIQDYIKKLINKSGN